MCETCGCDQGASVKIVKPGEEEHPHDHDHPHEHDHGHAHRETIRLEEDVLAANDLVAAHNRGFFEGKGIYALNLMSSPGSGKTTLLEKTVREAPLNVRWQIVEGDQQTTLDAARLEQAGAQAIQVNTGTGCHLDARMVQEAIRLLDLTEDVVLAIENVGNLVCPALFDLGEARRIIIISTTEGDDKPLKYPHIFHRADLCLINKTDLLPYVDFDVEQFQANARQINPELAFLAVSAKSGAGLEAWFQWLAADRDRFMQTEGPAV